MCFHLAACARARSKYGWNGTKSKHIQLFPQRGGGLEMTTARGWSAENEGRDRRTSDREGLQAVAQTWGEKRRCEGKLDEKES